MRVVLVLPVMGDACTSLGGPALSFGRVSRQFGFIWFRQRWVGLVWFGLVRVWFGLVWSEFGLVLPVMGDTWLSVGGLGDPAPSHLEEFPGNFQPVAAHHPLMASCAAPPTIVQNQRLLFKALYPEVMLDLI